MAIAMAATMAATTAAVVVTKTTAATAMAGDTDNNQLKGAEESALTLLSLLSPFPSALLFLLSHFLVDCCISPPAISIVAIFFVTALAIALPITLAMAFNTATALATSHCHRYCH
jgi:hypothetical protein